MSTPVLVFACNHSSDVTRCSTSGCGGLVTTKCAFSLRGRKEGQTCDRPLCAKCVAEKNYCPAHARATAS